MATAIMHHTPPIASNDRAQFHASARGSQDKEDILMGTKLDVVLLFAMLPEGYTIALHLSPSTPVEHVATLIKKRIGIPRRWQRLLVSGKVMRAGRTLADYGIPKNHFIIYVQRLKETRQSKALSLKM